MFITRKSLRAVIAVATTAAVIALGSIGASASAQTSAPTTVFAPSGSGYEAPGTLYPREITLHHNGDANGTILATWENYTTTTPYFPVYQSTNGGTSWTSLSRVTDTVNGYGMRWEPFLYELPAAVGALPAGTILAAGLSVPADKSSTEILLFDSTDRGATWSFLSSVAKGGAGLTADPNTPVWEPFILYYQGQLVVYFSDQRQNSTHSQLLDHETSTDGITWSAPVDDVVYPSQSARPGMTTVAAMNNGKWIMTYELCQTTGGSCPVYYKIGTDPLGFNSITGQQLLPVDGSHPCCQPYVAWTPSGGTNGTIVVSAGGQTPLLINTAGGAAGSWQSEASNAPYGYSRSLMLTPDGGTVMTMSGGSHDSTTLNSVQYAFDNIAPAVSVGATYTLANASSHLDLAIGGASTAEGAQVIQWPATGGAEQNWRFDRQADSYFTVTNANSGKVLAVAGASTSNGALMQQQTRVAGSASQEWAVVQGTDGTFTITNRKSNLPIEDPSFSTANGTAMDQWTDNGGANQHWTLTQTALPTLTTGKFALQNGLGKYLEIPAGSTAAGTQADQFWCTNQDWHLWTFTAVAGGYEIGNANSGLALTDEYTGGSSVVVDQQPATGAAKQLWTLVPSGSTYLIKNVGTGRYAATAGASTADGAPTVSWTATGGPEQAWTVRRID